MWFRLRKTFSRGRLVVPLRLTRMRRWRRALAARVSSGLNVRLLLLGAGLASLASDHFFGVLDAFALVRLGRPYPAHLGGDFANQLFIGTGDDDRVALDREAD